MRRCAASPHRSTCAPAAPCCDRARAGGGGRACVSFHSTLVVGACWRWAACAQWVTPRVAARLPSHGCWFDCCHPCPLPSQPDAHEPDTPQHAACGA